MATGGEEQVGYSLANVGTVTLENDTNMANCKRYLDFEPTEHPAWRSRLTGNDCQQIPTISEMISEILTYRKKYSIALSNQKFGREEKDKADRELLIKFLLNVQEEEKIGMRDAGKTEEVINYIDALELDENERGIKRRASIDSGSSQDSIDSEDNAKRRKANVVSRKVEQFELPCYPSLGNTEDEISSTYNLTSQTKQPAKEEHEIQNLYRGYKHIAKDVHETQMQVEDISRYLGLMVVETHILQTHKVLMDEIMDDHHTGPGTFSTNQREAYFNGVRHVYPHFATEESALAAVTMIVQIYDDMIDEIGKIPDTEGNREEKLKLSFKCASLFLFGFLTLHPFGDGNGRLARLLCSYSLLTFSPFLTPIYNVFSSTVEEDYVQALIVARKDIKISQMINTEDEAKQVADIIMSQKPSDLCALIIESNWSMWRKYLDILGIHKIQPYKRESGYCT